MGFKSFKNFDPSTTLFLDISGDIRGTDDGDFVTDASEDIFDFEDRLVRLCPSETSDIVCCAVWEKYFKNRHILSASDSK